MEWLDIISNRHTTFAWDEERVPSEELLLEVLQEVYTHIPSKNLQFPYQVRLMRNDDPEIRKEIALICKRNESMSLEEDRGNPQVLAPWLLAFNARWVADLEVRYETDSRRGVFDGSHGNRRTNDPHGNQTQTENIEIGIFSAFIMLALANRGIQSGMCQNISYGYTRATEIFNLAGDERALDFRFIMGIGYGKDADTQHEYLDPRTDLIRKIPFAPSTVETVYPRPAFEDVVKVVV
jgi:nitroreductase